jgi:hypothetical protein
VHSAYQAAVNVTAKQKGLEERERARTEEAMKNGEVKFVSG